MPDDPLAEWVALAQAGDQDAFGKLVEATHRDVYNVAFGVLRNAQEAEDVCQIVYVRVWRAMASFRGDARFKTWLYRVTVNACLNRKRSLRGQLRIVDDETLLERQVARSGDPLRTAERHDRQSFVWSAVGHLPEKYRLVITLFYQQQMSYQDIAELLSLPLGTVKAHLNRARKALAKRLEGQREMIDVLL